MAGFSDVIARLSVAVAMDASEFSTGSTKVQRDVGKLRDTFAALGQRWTQAGKRLSVGVTAPLAAFGIVAAKTASDAQELQSAFDETFDDMADSMDMWARKTGDAMGRSTQSIQEMAKTFGIFFNQAAPTRAEAAEMSKTFTVLAQDLSSFYNVDGDVALQKLRSGLSGESEPLRDFGVFLTEATVKAKAMEMGLTGLGDELTEQEKIMARYALILESTKDAQGDVARTSGGFANQWRSLTEAFDELQVTIGSKLLPVLTPFVQGITKLVNGFTNLPNWVQNVAIGFAAIAASIGPMMLIMGTLAVTILPLFAAKFGLVGIAISAFVNPLGTAISFLARFAFQLGSLTALKALAPMLLRFAGPLGLIATAGILIYQNWDKIAPVLREFWEAAKQALGPPIQELIATVAGMIDELMSGPLGDGIRSAIDFIGKWQSTILSAFGQGVLVALKLVLDTFVNVFRTIGDGIRIVNALLNGDWRGAITAAGSIVDRIFGGMPTKVIGWMARMVQGVSGWLMKLASPFNWVAEKLTWIGKLFFQLYDKVVGHSYIPDMVDGIAAHMARLDAVMVAPAKKAADKVAEEFQRLRALQDRLFPENRAALDFQNDRAFVAGRTDISAAEKEEYAYRLNRQFSGVGTGQVPVRAAGTGPLVTAGTIGEGIERVQEKLGLLGDKAKVTTVKIAKSFKDMADNTLSALQRMTDSIKGGGFLDILGAVIGLGMQLGSIGVFGKNVAARINAPRGYATGTASAARGLAWVGERGPELVNFRGGERVYNNRDSMGMGNKLQVEVVANNNGFGAIVRNHAGQVVAEAAPALMQGGAQVAQSQMAYRNTRRVA